MGMAKRMRILQRMSRHIMQLTFALHMGTSPFQSTLPGWYVYIILPCACQQFFAKKAEMKKDKLRKPCQYDVVGAALAAARAVQADQKKAPPANSFQTCEFTGGSWYACFSIRQFMQQHDKEGDRGYAELR